MNKNRFFTSVMAVILCLAMFSSNFAIKTSAALTGSGTESDPYIICSSSDLSKMNNSYDYFKLGADISFYSGSWTPINFNGVLDGDGHTIKTTRKTEGSTAQVALFNCNRGTIRNLNVDCALYHKFYEPKSSGKMGGICITNEGTIENCSVTGYIDGNAFSSSSYRNVYVGGICETNRGTICDCGVYADVDAHTSSIYCSGYAGGVCIYNDEGATITRCIVKNSVFSADGGGGVVERSNKGTVSECCVASSLSINGNAIARGGTVENCINFSTQSRGFAIGDGHINCINAGGIQSTGTTLSDSAVNSYDIGDQELVKSGYGLPMSKIYTRADFPALDFNRIWYITDYGVPYLRNLDLPRPQDVKINCDDKLYVGGVADAKVEVLPKNVVLYSLSANFTEGAHEATWLMWSAPDPALRIKPVSVGSARLTISDKVAGVIGFKNFNFAQGVESITVTGPTRMGLGQTIKLTAIANPSNAENTNIKFEESQSLPRRLTVRDDGTVTANYLGDAWLYVKSEDGNVSITYHIEVAKIPTEVILSDDEAILYPGEVKQLSASVKPADSEDTSYRWESSNPRVATVNNEGKITAISCGTAEIKAICNDGGAYGKCEVTVAQQPRDIVLDGPDTIVVGETATYKLKALPEGSVIREAHWQAENENLVKIEQVDLTTVNVTGVVGGKTQIQVNTGERTVCLDVNVVRYPDSVEISEEEIYLTVGQQKQLSAWVSPEDTTDKTVTWTSDNEAVASVSADGKVTAHAVGEALISCITADGKKSDQVLVCVQIPASSLEVEETDITLYVGEVRKINATVQPENATYKNVIMTPSNNSLEVNQESMSICGLRAGTCILQVSTPDGSLTKKLFVTVLEANHVYSDPVFIWNADYTECTAQRTCVNDCPHTQTYDCTVTTNIKQVATCVKEGMKVCVASVWIDGNLYETTRNVTIPKTGHIWNSATCTTARKCSACGITSGSELGHTYLTCCDADCDVCGYVRADIEGEWKYVNGEKYVKLCITCGEEIESETVVVDIFFNGENVNKKQILNKSTAKVTASVTDNLVNDFVFESSDDGVVSVDADGNVVANSIGKATITVTINSIAISDSIEVEVLPRDFTITWNVNGKQTEQTVKEYATITPNVDTTLPGYNFIGWDSEVPLTMPAENLSFTAKFEPVFKMSIRNPSTTTISYGDSIILQADINEALPSGWEIKWTADNGNFSYSANGETCTITPNKSGETTFTATVCDENGNEISRDTQIMKSKAGFFDKLIFFFKKLFGMMNSTQ